MPFELQGSPWRTMSAMGMVLRRSRHSVPHPTPHWACGRCSRRTAGSPGQRPLLTPIPPPPPRAQPQHSPNTAGPSGNRQGNGEAGPVCRLEPSGWGVGWCAPSNTPIRIPQDLEVDVLHSASSFHRRVSEYLSSGCTSPQALIKPLPCAFGAGVRQGAFSPLEPPTPTLLPWLSRL